MMGIAEEGNRLGRGQDGNKLTRLKTKVHVRKPTHVDIHFFVDATTKLVSCTYIYELIEYKLESRLFKCIS
jgi:hypothetical protein